MRKLFEKFMARFDEPKIVSGFSTAFNQSDIKLELITALKSARSERQLSAARMDGLFSSWDKLVLDLETILRKNS